MSSSLGAAKAKEDSTGQEPGARFYAPAFSTCFWNNEESKKQAAHRRYEFLVLNFDSLEPMLQD